VRCKSFGAVKKMGISLSLALSSLSSFYYTITALYRLLFESLLLLDEPFYRTRETSKTFSAWSE
jgi:hypothetical protein